METPVQTSPAWYETWFDSPYYHLLYKHRDNNEAATLLKNLSKKLEFNDKHRFLDLACGKGRHSIILNDLGYDVTGVDLSKNSILFAKQYEKAGLRFAVKDMREVVMPEGFTHVLSLFTSFGYFDTYSENRKVIESVWENLKEAGLFVIDFLNADKVLRNLSAKEHKTIAGIQFTISRHIEGNKIVKEISVKDTGFEFNFSESVVAYRLADFRQMFAETGFEIEHIWGNYALETFDAYQSDRLIICARKVAKQ